jgi:carboxyl-terminal processing protease
MPKYLKISISVLLAAIVLLLSFSAGLTYGRHESYLKNNNGGGLFKITEAISAIKRLYVEKVTDKKLSDGAVRGMVKELDDPFSNYFDKKHYSFFKEETQGHFDGIGIIIGEENKKITVISPLEGTPAEKAGIKAGDIIAKINGKTTGKMKLADAVKKIRGKQGTAVALTIYRPVTKKSFDARIVRQQITSPNVTGKVIDKKIGYIQFHSFNEDTTTKFKEKLAELKSKGIKGLIVDLRSNGGGLLDQAVELSSQFIETGPIVITRGRTQGEKIYNALGGANTTLPIVVLVNHDSASASEIFAGAIQDTKRGKIVGVKTYGKASVQQVVSLSDGSAISITIAHYFTPKGRMIAKVGIKPDFVVKFKAGNGDSQIEKAQKVLQDLISKR